MNGIRDNDEENFILSSTMSLILIICYILLMCHSDLTQVVFLDVL